MCSILGIGFQKGHTIKDKELVHELITDLLINGMSYGRTATGVCYTSMKKITIVKDRIKATDFVNTDDYKNSLKKYVHFDHDKDNTPLSIIGHCRQKTKGTEHNNNNNHPIVYGNVVGVHNGIISNDDAQFKKYRHAFRRKAQVDSEIIFALIDHFSRVLDSIPKSVQESCKDLHGGYACSMVHRYQPHILWLFRASSPCVVYHFKEKGIIMFASSSHFIINATCKHNLGDYDEIPLGMNEGLGIDLYRNKYQRIDLDIKSNATGRSLQ